MKKKILILANNDIGLYKFRKELIERLIQEGNSIYISVPKGPYISKLIELGCKHIDTSINRRGTNPLTDLKLIINYISIINKLSPGIILTYTIKPNIYGGIAARITKTPYIANVTGLGTAVENDGLVRKITMILYKIGIKKASTVFFQNNSNKDFFVNNKLIGNKYKLIPGSGVNLEDFKFEEYPEIDKKITLLFIGRIMKAKGIDELLECATRIKGQYPNIEFELIGSKEENYSFLLEKLEKDNIIKYHGRQDEIHNYIKRSHAVINPSHHEGMSNVLLESASTGRPVIASNIPGCKEIFDDGISGYAFEVKNVDSLTEKIIKFIKLPYNEKKEMGFAGRKKIEEVFDRQKVINSYIDEISNIKSWEK